MYRCEDGGWIKEIHVDGVPLPIYETLGFDGLPGMVCPLSNVVQSSKGTSSSFIGAEMMIECV